MLGDDDEDDDDGEEEEEEEEEEPEGEAGTGTVERERPTRLTNHTGELDTQHVSYRRRSEVLRFHHITIKGKLEIVRIVTNIYIEEKHVLLIHRDVVIAP